MKIKKKTWIPIVILLSLSLLVLFAIIGTVSGRRIMKEVRVFDSIDEIDRQSEFIVKNAEVKPDKNIQGLLISNGFACAVSCKGKQFVLYAYEFENEDLARDYFKNCTGISSDRTSNFSSSGGLFHARFVAYNGKNAYMVVGNDYGTLADAVDMISSDFSIVIAGGGTE